MYRSLLYVPATSERFIAKAAERGADALILDLEDSVAFNRKADARAGLADAVEKCGARGADVWVRINRPLSLAIADIESVAQSKATGIFITKAESSDHVKLLLEAVEDVERSCGRAAPLKAIALIETPGAVSRAESIARCDPRVIGLLGGGEDLATAMDSIPSSETLRLPKLLIHMAAKAAGKYSFGMLGTVADYADAPLIRSMAAEARRHGFDGATCVHPSVIPILNEGFDVGMGEIEAARSIVELAETASRDGIGAFVFEGKMIDLPVIERAKRLLARANHER